jgi:hypothetical protein
MVSNLIRIHYACCFYADQIDLKQCLENFILLFSKLTGSEVAAFKFRDWWVEAMKWCVMDFMIRDS